ncbi:MAG: CPBP family intramembrane glutamic endopeptidase [Ginsengibacter sp.]
MVNNQASQISFKEVVLIIFAIAFVFLFPHFAFLPVPFLYVLPVLLVVWWFLKRSGENFTDIGFDFKRFEIKSIFVGAASAIVLFVFLQYVFFPLLSTIIELHPANLEDFKSIKHHPFNFIFILMAGFFVGGFYEELVFHGFVFTRIEKIVKGKLVVPTSFILTNLIFGLYHFQLGTAGMLNAFLAGSAYQYLMMKFHRNLWYSIFFHAFFDAIGLTYIYLGIW